MHRTRKFIQAASERGRRMARARWAADRRRRDAEAPERIREIESAAIENLPRKQGDPIGCLQWQDFRTGKITRWTVRIGDRADRFTLHAPDGRATRPHGWTWITTHLRKHFTTHT
jgi:hypothetical protein